jgi:Lrp/AsnC family transcriptional regulator for asnA, asnC and gidA
VDVTASQLGSLSRVKDVAAPAAVPVALDELDLALLQELSADGRASQRSLAAALNVSTPTVSERMARLEKAGVITGYAAQIDWGVVGFGETVYLSITAEAGYDVAEIMERLWAIPEVHEVNLVTGDLDLLVRLRVRDNTHLRELLMDRVWQLAGMQGTATLLSVAEMPGKNVAQGLLQQMRNSSGPGE